MKFYFLRHADKTKADYTSARSSLSQPISAFGRKQAIGLKRYFQKIPIRAIYVSEYIRTAQTVHPLAYRLKMDSIVDPRLNEIDSGIRDKFTENKFSEKFPDVWSALKDRNRDFRWPGGESGQEAQDRITRFVNENIDQSGDILCVAHDGIIRLFACYVLNLPVYDRFKFQINTASINEFEWDPERKQWKVIRFNHTVG